MPARAVGLMRGIRRGIGSGCGWRFLSVVRGLLRLFGGGRCRLLLGFCGSFRFLLFLGLGRFGGSFGYLRRLCLYLGGLLRLLNLRALLL